MKKLFLLSILLVLSPLCLRAQLASSTSLTGTITDQSGAVVAGASVSAVDTGTQIAYKATTNQDGIYNVLYIPVGTYTISKMLGSVVINITISTLPMHESMA